MALRVDRHGLRLARHLVRLGRAGGGAMDGGGAGGMGGLGRGVAARTSSALNTLKNLLTGNHSGPKMW